LVVDEIIVKFKGRVIFKQYIPKKCKSFGIKLYKLCDSDYTYDMDVYLGKDRQVTKHLTATYAIVTNLTRVGVAISCTWTTFSPPLTYMMTLSRKKFTAVAL
jgi:hypothetical protein